MKWIEFTDIKLEIREIELKQFRCRFPYTGLSDREIAIFLNTDQGMKELMKTESLKIVKEIE